MRLAATICVAILLALGAAGASAQLMIETTIVGIHRDPCDLDGPQISVDEMEASGGSGKYSWRIFSGHPPHGLKLRSNGKWKGEVDWDWFDGNDDTFADIEVTDVETEEVVYAIVVFRSTGGDIGGSCCSGPPESPRWPAFIAGAIAFALTRLKRVDEQAAS
jgi:hypothetical protein